MTDSKEKHGEYIYYDAGKIIEIRWYTHGHFDCSLDVLDGEHSYNHGDGQLWQKYTLINGKPQGEWVLYHSNSQMSVYRKYENGLKEGTWKSWHDDGSQWDEQVYVNDKKDGKSKRWRYDEVLEHEGQYNNDKKDGEWIYYYDNGKREYQGKYKNGKKDGKWINFDESSGKKCGELNYKNGKLDGEYIELNGDLIILGGQYKDNKKIGKWIYTSDHGKVGKEENYSNGKLSGNYKEWHPDGTEWKIGNYKNGELDGDYTEYHKNGIPYLTGVYINGKMNSQWVSCFVDGKTWKSGSYKDDKKIDKWNYWHDNGKKVLEENYKNGILVGKYVLYFYGGQKKVEGFYERGKKNGDWNSWYQNECRKDFGKLKGTWVHDLLQEGEWFARAENGYDWPLTYKGSQRYIKRNNTGNKSSNFFQQENRWSVDGTISPGPLRTWGEEKFMTSLMGAAYTLKMEKIDKSTLRTMLGLRKYICSQFKPNAAKALYDYFDVKNVLDFSAGWGDRLAGFYASMNTELYVGIDPRKENHPIYEEQARYYDKHLTFFETPKKTVFHCDAAEDFDFDQYEDTFDIIFTSPPYFNVERYSYDDTQSWVRYKDIDQWNVSFLQSSIENMWISLRSGGKLCVNISDVNASSQGKKKKGWLSICDPMNEFIDTFKDSDYLGCIGMEMAARPNSLGAGTGVESGESNREPEMIKRFDGKFCEPVWIWEKSRESVWRDNMEMKQTIKN